MQRYLEFKSYGKHSNDSPRRDYRMNEQYDPVVAQEIADRSGSVLIKAIVAEANKQYAAHLANPWWKADKSDGVIKFRAFNGKQTSPDRD